MPFRFHLAMDTLPSGEPQVGGFRFTLACFRLSPSCPFRLLHTFHLLRPARRYPRVWIWHPSFGRQRDFDPPEQRAAQRTLQASPPPRTARPGSCELPVDPHCRSPLGLPVLRLVPLSACRRQYPGRTDGTVHSCSPIRRRPSLDSRRVGSCITRFGACTAFTFVTAYKLAKSPMRPSTPEASAASLPPLLLRLLPGGANSSRAGLSPAVDQRLFTAHAEVGLARGDT